LRYEDNRKNKKIFTIIAIVVIFIIGILIFKNKNNNRMNIPPNDIFLTELKEIDLYLSALMKTSSDDAFIIVTMRQTQEFIQFKYIQKYGLEIDFPLVTDRQKEQKEKIIKYTKELGLEFDVNTGTDGTEFIDIYFKEDYLEGSKLIKNYFYKIYGAMENAEVKVELSDVDLTEIIKNKT
jgi:hypothetical protein